MFKIVATAPTIYQLRSVSHFGPAMSNMDGSHTFYQEFETREEAISYLKERATVYADSFEELADLLTQIDTYGIVTFDAVSGGIYEIEEPC